MDAQTIDHLEAERGLRALLRDVRHLLTSKDQAEAGEYLTASEYGLALETIAGGLVERSRPVARSVAQRIELLAGIMRLSDRPFVRDVRAKASRGPAQAPDPSAHGVHH